MNTFLDLKCIITALMTAAMLSSCGNNSDNQQSRTVTPYKINDTGYVRCGDFSRNDQHDNQIDCLNNSEDDDGDTIPTVTAQDSFSGRDFQAANGSLVKVGAGIAGFDFTKLNENGEPLPLSADSWSCVRDNHTGLTWEAKNNFGLHNTTNTYRWLDSEEFVRAVNAENLCGYSNWRLPNREELTGLVAFLPPGSPLAIGAHIDTQFFPNTRVAPFSYLTSNRVAANIMNVWSISFGTGKTLTIPINQEQSIRLVRAP